MTFMENGITQLLQEKDRVNKLRPLNQQISEVIMKLQIQKIKNLKIFAYFGTDLEGYPETFLQGIHSENYVLLALDYIAVGLAIKSNLPFTIPYDWIDTEQLLNIQDIAWDCEINWFNDLREEFTEDGVCWPELDHKAMRWFWLDSILSFKLSDTFRENGIQRLLFIDKNETAPVVYYQEGSICKKIWRSELQEYISIIESRQESVHSLMLNTPDNIYDLFGKYLYASSESMKGKIAIFASDGELIRTKNDIEDIIKGFPNNVVIIPNQISDERICQYMNKWMIPVILPVNFNTNNYGASEKFGKAYHKLIQLSKGKEWEKSLSILNFHFLYYCQTRWPRLLGFYKYYFEIFSKHPPKVLIGSSVHLTEWHLPIFAAKQCGIQTISIPHSIYSHFTNKLICTDLINFFDYNFHTDLFSKEIIKRDCLISEDKFIQCIDSTRIHPYKFQKREALFSQNSLKILILFSPTSHYIHPLWTSRIMYCMKNPNKQIESIKILDDLSKCFNGRLSIRYKAHPSATEFELFEALGKETLEKLLPTDTDLEKVLKETDLIIGVNFFGSALLISLKNKIPFINFINDDFFKSSFDKESEGFKLLGPSVKTVRSQNELYDFIRKILSDPSVLSNLKSDITHFSDMYINDCNNCSIGEAIKEVLSRKGESTEFPCEPLSIEDSMQDFRYNFANLLERYQKNDVELTQKNNQKLYLEEELRTTEVTLRNTEEELRTTEVTLRNTEEELRTTEVNLRNTEEKLRNTNLFYRIFKKSIILLQRHSPADTNRQKLLFLLNNAGSIYYNEGLKMLTTKIFSSIQKGLDSSVNRNYP